MPNFLINSFLLGEKLLIFILLSFCAITQLPTWKAPSECVSNSVCSKLNHYIFQPTSSPNAYFLSVNDIIVLIIQVRSLELMLNHSFILPPTFAHLLNHFAYMYPPAKCLSSFFVPPLYPIASALIQVFITST